MAIIPLLALPLILYSPSLSSASDSLTKGSSLLVENTNDLLISPRGTFIAGFFPVGDNAYCFAIWFDEPFCNNNCTIVWMANRDQPVNGKRSALSLLKSGNLILTDAGRITVWATDTVSESSVHLQLQESGNLVLNNSEGDILWQSFDFPTNTLLLLQPLSKDKQLVSSRSQTNYSSGFYKLLFDNDNVLHLLFASPSITSLYWPDPELLVFEAKRSTYNNSRRAYFDPLGNFSSSDKFFSKSADYGANFQRRLTIDSDGNLRLYSREDKREAWTVSWQAISQPCSIHGICGPNSVCNYVPSSGRNCSCLRGFKMKDVTDWSLGCEPEIKLCLTNETNFLRLTNVQFYGYDYGFYPNYTLDRCKEVCSQRCDCPGFQFRFSKHGNPNNTPYCFVKFRLLNGFRSPSFEDDFYLKVPITSPYPAPVEESRLHCAVEITKLDRVYTKIPENGTLKFLLWFASIVGAIEFTGIFLVWCFLMRTHQTSVVVKQDYLQVATGFRKFTYTELEKATHGFREEIGRGAGGIVYRGVLSDHRIAAVKRLTDEASQGEAQFRAEVSVIGKLNHMNLIEMWGYCAEGKHRLVVYECMEHGSLADNLSSNTLDWKQRFNIALGVAKGLSYLHEECLEWVLHCDIKPQNILLDLGYQPKVSDFGLSHPLKTDSHGISRLSRIRGTRGYIAPEWVLNLPITSKVDVYSYGMVLLEMVTGKSPTADIEDRRLVTWVKENIKGASAMDLSMEKIVNPDVEGNYDKTQMKILVGVALKCANEDKDTRPTMRQVVEMLLQYEKHNSESVEFTIE
ncbi:hypothetical protein P3X46_028222 [Hevea brasiliensis]|uniref:Receptor-like serine/threonine-protein kinase n=1 Tax=Hevea brasiliensis TaxID=3981 RepID=A0ABQ9KQA4_HEVBR|nr:putative receptor protein kinase ZmPK1 [Hevea brasiliensis]KAJ9145894.1 hypothetical protein P3X46_028222 [Hevea brasiliensis]